MGPSIYTDYHQGYEFTITPRQVMVGAGFVADLDIRKNGTRVIPTRRNDDKSWPTAEAARNELRHEAWRLIDNLAKSDKA